MANPQVDLITLADAQAYLSAAGGSYGADLGALITAVSAQIQSYLSRNLVSQTYTRTFSGRGERRVLLPNTPITAVASVTVGFCSIPAATDLTSPGFVFDDTGVELRGGYRFDRGAQNCQIAYTGGFATIPYDAQQATREGILAVANALENDPRAIELHAGDTVIKYGDLGDLERIVLTPNVTSILRQLRRVVPV